MAQGKIPKYLFRDFYIHMTDFTYPYIDATKQVVDSELIAWILKDRKDKHTSAIFPWSWLKEATDIGIGLSAIYTADEQHEIHTILLSRNQNKQNRG